MSTTWVSNADYVESTILLDAQGGTHIVFNDDATNEKDLRHAYKPAAGTWMTLGGVSQGDVGKANSAAMDANGGIHVSYLDNTNKNLEYAFRCPD